jgi:hypothetical protein
MPDLRASEWALQYFKEQRALRTETTINNPYDFYINKGLGDPRGMALLQALTLAHLPRGFATRLAPASRVLRGHPYAVAQMT